MSRSREAFQSLVTFVPHRINFLWIEIKSFSVEAFGEPGWGRCDEQKYLSDQKIDDLY